ncbi:MAG: prepilin peptidase [Candidatus Chisholmbacteria bacterium]|nr:prepilin peptidase [Candidatus Chisholmbacteria bacterium]
MLSVVFIVFLMGLAVGSFLNVVVYRMLTGESFWRGRSKCPHCHRQIAWYDNIPLLSFLMLRGKCRWCGQKISWRYPVLEFLTALLFVWWLQVGTLFFRLTQPPYTWVQPTFWLVVGVAFLSMAVVDLYYGVLPDVFTVGVAVVAFLYRFGLTVMGIMKLEDFLLYVASAVGASFFFGILILLTKGKGMGWGDVKLAFAIGLVLGWPKTLVALVLAFLTGAIVGIILIISRKRSLKQTVPFGPFLVVGTLSALVWGERMWQTYMRYLGF